MAWARLCLAMAICISRSFLSCALLSSFFYIFLMFSKTKDWSSSLSWYFYWTSLYFLTWFSLILLKLYSLTFFICSRTVSLPFYWFYLSQKVQLVFSWFIESSFCFAFFASLVEDTWRLKQLLQRRDLLSWGLWEGERPERELDWSRWWREYDSLVALKSRFLWRVFFMIITIKILYIWYLNQCSVVTEEETSAGKNPLARIRVLALHVQVSVVDVSWTS